MDELFKVRFCEHMPGVAFENFIAELYCLQGYKVSGTPRSGDQGVDLILEDNVGTKIAVQCKRYKGNVGNSAVQQIFAGKHFYKCEKGMVVSAKKFTPSAKKLAKDLDIELISSVELQRMIDMLGMPFYQSPKVYEIFVNLGSEIHEEAVTKHQYHPLKQIKLLKDGIELMYSMIKLAPLTMNKRMTGLAFNNLGLMYFALKEYDLAIQRYSQGLEIDETFVLRYNLAIAYKNKGEYLNAKEALEKLIPRTGTAYSHEGEFKRKLMDELDQLLEEQIQQAF